MFRLLIILAMPIGLFAQTSLRSEFHEGMFDEDALEAIISTNENQNSAIVKGYIGISETMMADHVYLPTSKLGYFNKGKLKLNEAIEESPSLAELRYLRLLVQLNAPSFLGYNTNIRSDFQVFNAEIVNELKNKSWAIVFIDNLMAADHVSESQVKKLEALKKQVQK